MSKSTLHIFLLLLKKGKWKRILETFYKPSTCVEYTEERIAATTDTEWLLNNLAASSSLLQHKVDKIEVMENKISFTIYTVTKDINNQIDFVEHNITSLWKNNRIEKHLHQIAKH